MNNKKITVEEFSCNIRDGKSALFQILNTQINNYKLQFLSEWERNHNICSKEKDRKIEILESSKQELLEFLKDFDSPDAEIKYTLHLEVDITNKLDSTHSKKHLAI